MEAQTKFTKWVNQYGKLKLCYTLDVGEATVRNWTHGNTAPTAETIAKILKLSKGKLTFEDVFYTSRKQMH